VKPNLPKCRTFSQTGHPSRGDPSGWLTAQSASELVSAAKTGKRASRALLTGLKAKAVEEAIAKRPSARFSVTKTEAQNICTVANGILKQQASSLGIELEDNDLLTPSQTLKWLSGIKRKKKSGL
jgi:hypothetical protein